MELRPGLAIDDAVLADFVSRHGVRRLALYGSVLRDDFGPVSDVDILVAFKPGKTPGLLRLAQMELELEAALGRQVELRTYEDLSRFFRDEVAAIARPLCGLMTAPAFGTSPRPRPRQSPTAPIVSAVTSTATSSSGWH